MKPILFTIIFLSSIFSAQTQQPLDPDIWLSHAANRSLDSVILDAEEYFDKAGRNRATGYKRFLRWWYKANINKSSNDGYAKNLSDYTVKLYNNKALARRIQVPKIDPKFHTWKEMGPFREIGMEVNNIGRLMSVSIGGPQNKTLVITSDGGGIWKSLNDGATWQDISRTLPVLDLGYATMAPSNSDIIFTTERSATRSAKSRLFKSIDGGHSFKMINGNSLTHPRKILVHPENPDKLWICAKGCLWYSNNGGETLTKVINNNDPFEIFYDIAFKPNDNNTIYASSDKKLYKSIDGGLSFTPNTMLNITNVTRIATLPSNPDLIWVAEKGPHSDKIHRSVDSGNTFTTESTPLSYVGHWPGRNMAFAIHPNFPNVYYLGGINFYRWSENHPSGNRWQPQHRIHADIQEIQFVGNSLYVVTDGGISKIIDDNSTHFPTAKNISFLNSHLPVKQIWKLSSSKTNTERIIYGSQDNGTAWYKNGNWEQLAGGDGGSCVINPENPDIYYGTISVNKKIVSNVEGFIAPTVPEQTTQYIFPMEIDRKNPSTVYYAGEQLFRQDSPTSQWKQVGNFTWPNNIYYSSIDLMKVAPSNSDILYLVNNVMEKSTYIRTALIYKSIDKGKNWQQIQAPTDVNEIKYIAVHPIKQDQISIITSQNKVFESENAGGNWKEIITNTGSNPLYAMIYDGSENGKYITSIGKVIYSRDDMKNPLDLSGNLPLVQITDIDINPALRKVYIGTYGRGVFKTNLYEDENLGISHINTFKEEILVYPSPFQNTLYIEYKNNKHKTIFKIHDSTGKIIKKGEILEKTKINTEHLPPGIYIVSIKSKNGTINKKIMK